MNQLPPGPRSRIPGALVFQFRRDVLGFLTQLFSRYGDAVSFRAGIRRFYLFYHPDTVREVLVTHDDCFIKGPALRQAKNMLGNGLLTSEGDFHKRQRRLSQPAFHTQRVGAYVSAMTHFAAAMAARWQDGQAIDIHEQMMRLTLSVVAKTLFDADVESDVAEIGQAMDVSVRMFKRAMVPFGQLLNKLPLPSNFKFWKARRLLFGKIAEFIAQRRAGGVDRGDLLSMLLRASDTEGDGSGMDDLQLRDECITLFTAGHETTANALSFTWYLLARHPDAEAAMYAEIREVLQGRLPTGDDVPRLVYTRAVLAESMRLYPPAWAIGREVKTQCRIGSYVLKPGAVVLLSQWVTHRMERFWPDAGRFDPGRWIGKSDRPRYAYFPFGGGARACIGESFAWMEAILLLATLAQRWRVEVVEEGPLKLLPAITLRPMDGIRGRVHAREAAPSQAQKMQIGDSEKVRAS